MPAVDEDGVADVAVIIPTWNRARLLPQAVESALVQLAPGRLAIEVIVVDDGSTDDTPAVLKAYGERIRAVRLDKNAGHCAARNQGMLVASSRYLKFLDSDDVLVDKSLEDEVRRADETGADIVTSGWGQVMLSSNCLEVESSRRIHRPPLMEPLPDAILLGRAVPIGAALYRWSTVRGLSWDPTIRKLGDWDWFCMAALKSSRIASRRGLAFWIREHPGPRVTSSSTMLDNAVAHHRVLGKIEAQLRQDGRLTDDRRRRLAQYYYKQIRILRRHDRPRFEEAVCKILALDPKFAPRDEEREWYMRVLSKVIGFRRAILLHEAMRRGGSAIRGSRAG